MAQKPSDDRISKHEYERLIIECYSPLIIHYHSIRRLGFARAGLLSYLSTMAYGQRTLAGSEPELHSRKKRRLLNNGFCSLRFNNISRKLGLSHQQQVRYLDDLQDADELQWRVSKRRTDTFIIKLPISQEELEGSPRPPRQESSEIAEVKRQVRKRDGYRCTRCGVTQRKHKRIHKTRLHVHRTTPGSWYTADDCVTLCRKCHGDEHGKLRRKKDGPTNR